MTSDSTALAHYDTARKALAEARSIDEVKAVRDKSEAIRIYAKQMKDKDLEINAAEIRLRAERRWGQLYADMKDAGIVAAQGRPGKNMPERNVFTLEDLNVTPKLSSRAQKLANVPNDDFENAAVRWRTDTLQEERPVSLKAFYDLADGKERTPHVAQSTGEFEWYSPTEIVEAARKVCGEFDLDPASSDMAQQTVRAKAYYTEADDGLSLDWYGRIWMNPPYRVRLIDQFIHRLCASALQCQEATNQIHRRRALRQETPQAGAPNRPKPERRMARFD